MSIIDLNEIRIVTSADSWCHIDFLPMWSAGWKRFLPELKQSIIIVGAESTDELKLKYGKYVDTLEHVDNYNPYYGHVLAKMARLWYACQFGDEIVMIEDIDLIPLRRDFRANKLLKYEHGKLMLMGQEVYAATDPGRTPMGGLTAPSKLLREIVNPDDLQFRDFVDQYRDTNPDHTQRWDTLNAPHFSDEILLQKLIESKMPNIPIQLIERGYCWETDTADRAVWDRLNYNKLWRGEYLEAHMLKNYLPNMVVCDKLHQEWGIIPGLKPIMDYIGFQDERMPEALRAACAIYGQDAAEACFNATAIKAW